MINNGTWSIPICAVSSTVASVLVEGLGSLAPVFVDEATKSVAAHDRPRGPCEVDGRSALGYSQVQTIG